MSDDTMIYSAPMSAVIKGINHFGRAKRDMPYCHGYREQRIGEKVIRHYLNGKAPKEASKAA